MSWWNDKPYQSVADRRAMAKKEMDARRASGQTVTPIAIAGRAIANTFWGKAWCDHIEQLADFESRLAKGKTYVRNGSVCHLEIREGKVLATVAGSEVYDITVEIHPLKPARWAAIKRQCAGQVGTALELLQGRFSDAVMRVLTDPKTGMFPSTDEFDLDCSCPDFVRLCKHLAAVLYGVGARLDAAPELLFQLRGVDPTELIDQALDAGAITSASKSTKPTIADADLSDVFGIDIDLTPAPAQAISPDPVADESTAVAPDKTARRKVKKKKKAVRRSAYTDADMTKAPVPAKKPEPQTKGLAVPFVKRLATKSAKAKTTKANAKSAKPAR